ncbi:MAG: ABC transporter substrate-binding protein [Methylovulum sp.]|nr:ABC transporter substrate-binding protein [Methylovulum sp.]MCF7997693.1 ABC transporter substrate-binding protein [Methylovulum sp.]
MMNNRSLFSRRGFLHLAASSLLVAAMDKLVGCANGQPLRVAAQATWPGYALMYLARRQGLFSEKEVALLNTTGLSQSTAMLLNGEADAAAITLDEVLHVIGEGVPLSVLVILDVSAGGDAVLAREWITNLANLKGRTIGVENSNLGAIMLAKLLEAAELKREDVKIVPMRLDHLESLEHNRLDAIITYEPNPTLLEKMGFVRLFDTRSLPNLIVDLLAVRQDREKQHAHALQSLIKGHFQALKLWQINPDDTAYHLGVIMDTPVEDVKKSFYGLNLPDINYNIHYLTAPADELNQSVSEISNIMQREGLIKHPVRNDRLFITDYLPEGF